MIVRSEHDLPTVRVRMSRTYDRPSVDFEAVRGRGEVRQVATVPVRDLGLPDRVEGTRSVSEAMFALPPAVLDRLRDAAGDLGDSPAEPHEALWLELPPPRGALPLVPWERLLAPVGRPLLRLPNHVLRPQASDTTLDVAICASTPTDETPFHAAAELVRAAGVWRDRAGHEVTVHLFTDVDSVDETASAAAGLGAGVRVHDPREGRRGDREGSYATAGPWLSWVRESLQGNAVDVVHVLAHGFLSGDRGALALASTPDRDSGAPTRLVDSAELLAFLGRVGAWSLVLSGPQRNYSPAGLRALGDAVALALPGVCLVHDLGDDPDASQLAATVGMVYAGVVGPAQPLPAVTSWVHPQFVEFPEEERYARGMTEDGRSALLGEATARVLDSAVTPAWVAAGARSLEAQQAEWLPSGSAADMDPAAVTALESVSSLLDRHVRAEVDDAGGAG